MAMKIKGSQGKRRIVQIKCKHPYTAISSSAQVYTNHDEAHKAAMGRRCSPYCRRQNHYAETVSTTESIRCSMTAPLLD